MTPLRIIALILTLSATVRGEPLANRMLEADAMKSLVALTSEDLRGATTIIIAESKEPEGAIISEIIRGNALEFKVGDRWKDGFPPTSPRAPFLISQKKGDVIGKLPPIPATTGYHQLDETKRFIVFDSTNHATGKKQRLLVPLAWVLQQLKAP